jgi:tyrosyl-tRNA synthetase
VWLVLKEAGLVPSTSEARRMIQQGAVEVDRRRVTSTEETLTPGSAYLIQVGKRRFKRVVLEGAG